MSIWFKGILQNGEEGYQSVTEDTRICDGVFSLDGVHLEDSSLKDITENEIPPPDWHHA